MTPMKVTPRLSGAAGLHQLYGALGEALARSAQLQALSKRVAAGGDDGSRLLFELVGFKLDEACAPVAGEPAYGLELTPLGARLVAALRAGNVEFGQVDADLGHLGFSFGSLQSAGEAESAPPENGDCLEGRP